MCQKSFSTQIMQEITDLIILTLFNASKIDNVIICVISVFPAFDTSSLFLGLESKTSF